jgi:hypothetical protein
MRSLSEVLAGTGTPNRQAGNKYRRGSVFVLDELAIGRPLDRNDKARILFCAEALERRTKDAGRRNGCLGYVGLAILRCLLLRFLGPRGLCCPSYVTLQLASGLCMPSIAAGLKRLEASGILKITRRLMRQVIERVSPITGELERIVTTVQGSNLYSFAVPGNLPGFHARSDTTQQAPNRLHDAKSNHIKGSFKCESHDGLRRPAVLHRFVSEAALDQVRVVAPQWDRQALLAKFLAWPGSRKAENMDAAFLGWVKCFTGGKPPA